MSVFEGDRLAQSQKTRIDSPHDQNMNMHVWTAILEHNRIDFNTPLSNRNGLILVIIISLIALSTVGNTG